MPLVSERGFAFSSHHSERAYTAGSTVSHDFHLRPGQFSELAVHVGLTQVSGTADGPGGATIGISQISGQAPISDPQDWLQMLFQAPVSFTVSTFVFRGSMKGWAVVQGWD